MTTPTPEQFAAARHRTVPDVIAPGLRLLFCGINPGLYSAAVGHHFARPGNRFWPALHQAGLTPRLLVPGEERDLLTHGLGITNLVARATATAADLSADELASGGQLLLEKVETFRPDTVAFLGVTAYRLAFGRKRATVGRQDERIGPAAVWVLPNPSGLNAHYQLADLARLYARLREAGPAS